jgi:hypothetical protein
MPLRGGVEAVGIGHYLGAKVMITASFDRFANFSQFSRRSQGGGGQAKPALDRGMEISLLS